MTKKIYVKEFIERTRLIEYDEESYGLSASLSEKEIASDVVAGIQKHGLDKCSTVVDQTTTVELDGVDINFITPKEVNVSARKVKVR